MYISVIYINHLIDLFNKCNEFNLYIIYGISTCRFNEKKTLETSQLHTSIYKSGAISVTICISKSNYLSYNPIIKTE